MSRRNDMRTHLVLFILAVSGSLAQGQDQAAQQAAQQSQQAMQQAQEANQRAIEDMNRQMAESQTAAQNTPNFPLNYAAPKPTFSVKPGTYSSTKTVKIKDSMRGAVIYYTTDGWTPTTASMRYTGPVTVDSTMTLQAIAVGPYPYALRSRVTTAQYTLNAASKPAATSGTTAINSAATAVAQGEVPDTNSSSAPGAAARGQGPLVLAQGTTVNLVFQADVSSKKCDVGDQLELALAEDLKVGDVVVAKKGARAVAKVTEADGARAAGVPGEIAFEMNYLTINNQQIRLDGAALKEGADKFTTTKTLLVALGPLAPAALLKHGQEAEIKKGTAFAAVVDADTAVSPAN
jgi:hypothetical protein